MYYFLKVFKLDTRTPAISPYIKKHVSADANICDKMGKEQAQLLMSKSPETNQISTTKFAVTNFLTSSEGTGLQMVRSHGKTLPATKFYPIILMSPNKSILNFLKYSIKVIPSNNSQKSL